MTNVDPFSWGIISRLSLPTASSLKKSRYTAISLGRLERFRGVSQRRFSPNDQTDRQRDCRRETQQTDEVKIRALCFIRIGVLWTQNFKSLLLVAVSKSERLSSVG